MLYIICLILLIIAWVLLSYLCVLFWVLFARRRSIIDSWVEESRKKYVEEKKVNLRD